MADSGGKPETEAQAGNNDEKVKTPAMDHSASVGSIGKPADKSKSLADSKN